MLDGVDVEPTASGVRRAVRCRRIGYDRPRRGFSSAAIREHGMDIHGSQVPFGQDLHERAACELAPKGRQRRQNDSHAFDRG